MADDLNIEEFRKRLSLAMAEAIDDRETMEKFLARDANKIEYGYAPADGAISADILVMLSYADVTISFIKEHGLEFVSFAGSLASLYAVFDQKRRGMKNDLSDAEDQDIRNAIRKIVEEVLNSKR